MNILSATDVRKNWSVTLDSVIHERPAYIKRTRDNIAILNMDLLTEILSGYKFNASRYIEDDGSITLSADEIDIVVNAKDDDQAIAALASDIKEYAEEYYDHFSSWSIAPNRRPHIPYVLKALSLSEASIRKEIQVSLEYFNDNI